MSGETRPAELVKPEGWSEEDVKWLHSTVAPTFHSIAAKHGRLCFSLVMQAGKASMASGIVQECIGFCASKHIKAKGIDALRMMILISNDLLVKIMRDAGITQEAFAECKREIETMGALAMQGPEERGKIIIAH